MNVRRLRETNRLGALVPWSGPITVTSTTHASGCSNANTNATFLVLPIIHATLGVEKLVDNAVDIATAVSHVGNLVRHV